LSWELGSRRADERVQRTKDGQTTDSKTQTTNVRRQTAKPK
jgi:hypothetical protein